MIGRLHFCAGIVPFAGGWHDSGTLQRLHFCSIFTAHTKVWEQCSNFISCPYSAKHGLRKDILSGVTVSHSLYSVLRNEEPPGVNTSAVRLEHYEIRLIGIVIFNRKIAQMYILPLSPNNITLQIGYVKRFSPQAQNKGHGTKMLHTILYYVSTADIMNNVKGGTV